MRCSKQLVWYLKILLLYGSATVIIICLMTYNAHDSSLLHATTQHNYTHNWFGWFGASIAAYIFFIFGSAGWLLIPHVLWFCLRNMTQKSWWYETDRIIAGIILLFSLSTLLRLMRFGDTYGYCAGGYIGYHIHRWLLAMMPLSLEYAMLIIITLSCIITMTRLLFMVPFLYGIDYVFYMPKLYLYKLLIFVKHYNNKLLYSMQKIIRKPSDSMTKILSIEEIIAQEYQSDDTILEWQWQKQEQRINNNVEDMMPLHNSAQENSITHHTPKAYQSMPYEHSAYHVPPVTLFQRTAEKNNTQDYAAAQALACVLEQKLERFGIMGSVININIGPVITLFEYEPTIDTKISKIIALEDDLALALQAISIRIIAPIPGRSVVGFEIANKQRAHVMFADLIAADKYHEALLPLLLGCDVVGNVVIADLAKMPHLLIAGSTGSGKSVALNTMVMSLLCTFNPDELKIILIDPKRLEFAPYHDIAHLLFPIITNSKSVAPILRWLVQTMEYRYSVMAEHNVRNIFDYNALCKRDTTLETMPFIVVIIDELADIMICSGRDIEELMARITQMARAAGIHMIVATQRPSVDVITGLIKVNFPCRISFKVTSKIDSRTILDCIGADKLLGKGDMLFLDGDGILRRVHGAYLSVYDIERVTNYIRSQKMPQYLDISQALASTTDREYDDDPLFNEILMFVKTVDEISISLLQRRFRIGYNRSARIIEMLEEQGIIMPSQGGKTRKVIR